MITELKQVWFPCSITIHQYGVSMSLWYIRLWEAQDIWSICALHFAKLSSATLARRNASCSSSEAFFRFFGANEINEQILYLSCDMLVILCLLQFTRISIYPTWPYIHQQIREQAFQHPLKLWRPPLDSLLSSVATFWAWRGYVDTPWCTERISSIHQHHRKRKRNSALGIFIRHPRTIENY